MLGTLHLRATLSAAALTLLVADVARAAGDAAGHGAGGIKEDLPFWGVVAFIGFLIAIKKLGWDSLTSGMREREANENRLIADAEQLRAATAEQLRQNKGKMESLDELVRQTLAEAQRDADHTRKDIRAAAEKEASLSRQRAEQEISRVQNQSLSDLFETMSRRIAVEAEARIRKMLTAGMQQKLIDAAVGEFVAQKP
jgi:F0F1-type ATP synthase membrane subunit b/b'